MICIEVKGYTRRDGTIVKGYERCYDPVEVEDIDKEKLSRIKESLGQLDEDSLVQDGEGGFAPIEEEKTFVPTKFDEVGFIDENYGNSQILFNDSKFPEDKREIIKEINEGIKDYLYHDSFKYLDDYKNHPRWGGTMSGSALQDMFSLGFEDYSLLNDLTLGNFRTDGDEGLDAFLEEKRKEIRGHINGASDGARKAIGGLTEYINFSPFTWPENILGSVFYSNGKSMENLLRGDNLKKVEDYLTSGAESIKSKFVADLDDKGTLRKTGNHTIRKVKRNFEGSYAIFNGESKSEVQFNSTTVKYLKKMSDGEFSEYAKTLNYEEEIKSEFVIDQPQERLAPNGKPSNLNETQYNLVRTPEFKKWFGDWESDPENASKVVDENGEPLVVYHGTEGKSFEVFDLNKLVTNTTDPNAGLGFHFSADRAVADNFANKLYGADNSGHVFATFINLRKPLFEFGTYEDKKANEVAQNKYSKDLDQYIIDNKEYDRALQKATPYGEEGWWLDEGNETVSDWLDRMKKEGIRRLEKKGINKPLPPNRDFSDKGRLATEEEISQRLWNSSYVFPSTKSEARRLGKKGRDIMKSSGIDGVGYNIGLQGELKGANSTEAFIVLEPNQIKLADGSNTTFDPENDSILRQAFAFDQPQSGSPEAGYPTPEELGVLREKVLSSQKEMIKASEEKLPNEDELFQIYKVNDADYRAENGRLKAAVYSGLLSKEDLSSYHGIARVGDIDKMIEMKGNEELYHFSLNTDGIEGGGFRTKDEVKAAGGFEAIGGGDGISTTTDEEYAKHLYHSFNEMKMVNLGNESLLTERYDEFLERYPDKRDEFLNTLRHRFGGTIEDVEGAIRDESLTYDVKYTFEDRVYTVPKEEFIKKFYDHMSMFDEEKEYLSIWASDVDWKNTDLGVLKTNPRQGSLATFHPSEREYRFYAGYALDNVERLDDPNDVWCTEIKGYTKSSGEIVQAHKRCYDKKTGEEISGGTQINTEDPSILDIIKEVEAEKEAKNSLDFAFSQAKERQKYLQRVVIEESRTTEPQRLKVEELEDSIKNELIEHMYVVDKDGKEVAYKKGGPRSVDLVSLISRNQKVFWDNMMSHNHPGLRNKKNNRGASLSFADIRTSFAHGASGIRAVAGDYTYEMTFDDFIEVKSLSEDRWIKLERHPEELKERPIASNERRSELFKTYIQGHLQELHRENLKFFNRGISAGIIEIEEANVEHFDYLWEKLRERVRGFNYRVVRLKR